MSMMSLSIAAAMLLSGPVDEPAKRPNGPFQRTLRVDALVGADVVSEPGHRIEDATIILRDGLIEAVGTDVAVPEDARVWSVEDMVIYPGLVEPALMIEIEQLPTGPGTHWNGRIHPQVDLRTDDGLTSLGDSQLEDLREAGYCVAAVYPSNGIFRGTGVVVTTAEEPAHRRRYDADTAMAAAHETGGWGGDGPGSLMGAIALMRQVLDDARWYEQAQAAARLNGLEPPGRHDALAALHPVITGTQRLMIEADDVKNAMRSGRLADEIDFRLLLLGSGTEYRDLEGVTSLGCDVIVPVDYPSRPRLDSADAALRVPLQTLQAWEQAPTNLRRLNDAGVFTCVTTVGLSSPSAIRGRMADAIRAGLDEDEALAQLTTRPAALLGIEDHVGRIQPGMAAHLMVCDKGLFENGAKVSETWVSGRRDAHTTLPLTDLSGSGTLVIGDATAEATLNTKDKKLTVTMADDTKLKTKKVETTGHRMTAAIDGRMIGHEGWVRLAGVIRGDGVIGRAVLSDGSTMPMRWTLDTEATEPDAQEEPEPEADTAADEIDGRDPIAGQWSGELEFGSDFNPPVDIEITHGDDGVVTGTMTMMERTRTMKNGQWDAASSTLSFTGAGPQGRGFNIAGVIDSQTWSGTATSPFGEASFRLEREHVDDDTVEVSTKVDKEEDAPFRFANIPDDITFPLGARGRTAPVQPENVRFEHATLWTCGPAGIVDDGCLVVRDGHITYAGAMTTAPDADGERIVDATGMHITPGLIDCHSHTGITGGVNEGSSACTAMVGIGDVVAGDSIYWYRQLAGGLTACNQLHGSANPIGGRNSVVKLRWGRPARDFPVQGAPKGIKFALGENVKRSSGRYPDTRMGVEAFIRDRLAAAQAYAETWDRWNAMTPAEQAQHIPPRIDHELATLEEILAGDRLIHCHSYRQDEILALLRTCEDYGIRIGTLQHILEGYKVADDIAAHGAGASSFSDWWAYKVEVMDAIPYNGAIMHEQGVVVSFNSDDSELASRMNDEAAKAVRYGDVPPHEALKFVTLNPAIQLGIDDRTGSLEMGKDADFAVWNRDPLDSYSLCQQTWIDGARYFDRQEEAELAARDNAQRTRLVELVLRESLGEPPEVTVAESEDETTPAWALNPYRYDLDERGVCGCSVLPGQSAVGLPADHCADGHDHSHKEHGR